ncbi:MAG: ribose 5-phosphate isomerase B [Sphingobacteriaceae bacterium]|nr:ribose 5-phosphate isomerase B [Sphingobacteriaceae bacterium]
MKYQTQKVSIGSDHAGYLLKAKLEQLLVAAGLLVHDQGPHTADSVDYPDYAHPVAKQVAQEGILGILICGSGNGVCMTANKHAGIRAALCWNKELAMLARQHNNANILCIPARFVSEEVAIDMVEAFLSTAFEGGRHATRVNKIIC